MKLLQNEEKLISSNEDKIILTNHRIILRDKILGKAYNISIFLEDISSIEVKYKSNILFLIIGIILAFIGLVMSDEGQVAIGGLVIGVIFLFIWWFTRKHIVIFSSDGGSSLNFVVQGMTENKIEDFITSVQEAKLKRINQLFKL